MRKIPGIKTFMVAVAIMSTCYVISACTREQKDDNSQEASSLYERTCQLTRQYIDSIKVAKDSTQVANLIDRYEVALDKMNFDVSADTDFNLTEGQNDTINQLMEQMSAVRHARLKAMAIREEVRSDSLPEVE